MKKLEYMEELITEISAALSTVDDCRVEALTNAIMEAPHVFISGSGRSGLSIREFAMRLMHMGISVYVLGEVVTPGLQAGDLLIIASGSGETEGQVAIARKAKKLGGKIGLITIKPGSAIDDIADYPVYINAPATKLNRLHREGDIKVESIQPMASLFEQCILLVLDLVIVRLMKKRGWDSDEMFSNHVNLE
ncbi:MAG: 6-phospho-3-hexuloisomerase [Eubacteriales bacterium]|nr:6-phospho-3-hexuloisomerase [Eubacteriales bacterium]